MDNAPDISTDELLNKGIISRRSANVCKRYSLSTLVKIIDYYERHGNFLAFKNCGQKSTDELAELCSKYNGSFQIAVLNCNVIDNSGFNTSNELVENLTNDISIEDLYDMEPFSVRAKNVCIANGLNNLSDLLKHYKRNNSFLGLKNCGNKSERQLMEICEKYRNHFSQNLVATAVSTNELLDKYELFNPRKKVVLNRHIQYLFSKLHIRAQNAVHRFFKKKPNPKELIAKIYSDGFHFQNIDYAEEKAIKELIEFKTNISSFIYQLQSIREQALTKEFIMLIVKANFKKLPSNIDRLFENITYENGKIKLFSLLHILIENGFIFNKTEKAVFFRYYLTCASLGLDLIGKLEVTKERIRQIKAKVEKEFQVYFKVLNEISKDDFPNYDVEQTSLIKVIDQNHVDSVNLTENVGYNRQFYSLVMNFVLQKEYCLLGDKEIFSTKNNKTNSKYLINSYLVNRSIFSDFKFGEFLDSINISLIEIEESYSLHFEGYISQFFIGDWRANLNSVKEVCELLIFIEFDLVVSSNGYLDLEYVAKKNLTKYVYDALEILDEMTTVDDITFAITKKYPELNINQQSVRSSLQRDSHLFIYYGRTSTYGLKKWEKEKKMVKGGTIRNLAIEYLRQFKVPKSIKDISSFIEQYRPDTYLRSILDNLKADKSGMFIFFGNGIIGLSDIQYPNKFVAPEKRTLKSWDEKYLILKNFKENNPHRWPEITSTDFTERTLYLFLFKNKVAYQNKTLDLFKVGLLQEIGFDISSYKPRPRNQNKIS